MRRKCRWCEPVPDVPRLRVVKVNAVPVGYIVVADGDPPQFVGVTLDERVLARGSYQIAWKAVLEAAGESP